MILSDAELVLGLSRHLTVYSKSAERARLEQLEFVGWIFDLAFRLRGSTTSTPQRVNAIATDIGLGQRDTRDVIAEMEKLGWLAVDRHPQTKAPLSVAEAIPAPADLINSAPAVLEECLTQPHEWAVIEMLRATTIQPLLVEDALHKAAARHDAGDTAAQDALRHLVAVGLLRQVIEADGREVLYNPNVWTQGDGIAQAALKAADARATGEVTALLEELAANPGLPENHVTSTESRWITFAVTQGLVQRSVIQTSEGVEQAFLFTPHLGRDPFGGTAGDASGQVRQLVGSMIYAATFAQYKLHSPEVFLRKLINEGVAGDVTSIGTDYPMLEKAGVVKVVPGSSARRFRLELLRQDVAEDALKLLKIRESGPGDGDAAAALRAQRLYVHVEKERARLALSTQVDEVEQQRLIAALREVPTQRTFGARP
ncbi:hypothetical protein [Mycobacteroides abscessus]|uniref:hypothetical protein n=1 Tax=Mycobacteroides abscessus TaxID=36809 RepID=UPI0005E3C678|nr:hypothetical protein [Mycobacteroides abscessus]CPR96195.1 Uncharacterised protein [Mycobacteroides abscessus]CPS62268.1 Uncharacterised protein [Mycobacteroides abscessus]CPY44603.1 Uncharacterised protein [Mycobacteroides abscessus]CPY52413.1 Uncharacterised protein [Mycobacteroides abscessus]SLI81141.1 Uncharacterised protein [Mycobacteroides abscessus subsp. abscessus]